MKGFNPLETMRNAMVPWCKRTLIVSIYNQQTFVKQIVGNMSQCPTSTLSLILARDLNHSICYKHRLLDWIVLSRYGQIQTLQTRTDKWFLDILQALLVVLGHRFPDTDTHWSKIGKRVGNLHEILDYCQSWEAPEYIRTKTVSGPIRLHLQVRKLQKP